MDRRTLITSALAAGAVMAGIAVVGIPKQTAVGATSPKQTASTAGAAISVG